MKKIYLILAALVFATIHAQDCQNTDPAAATGSQGCVTFNYKGSPVQYTTVRASDGNIWLQQNLGSTQVATSATDESSYGDLFQWGRWDDGHQSRTSETITTPPSPNNPSGLGGGNARFYTSSPRWWNDGVSIDKWEAATPTQASATDGCDPCKAIGNEWRLPTAAEWQAIITAENITNVATGYGSTLKLAVAGSRDSSGNMNSVGVRGYYWTKEPSATNALYAKYFYMTNLTINPNAGGFRSQGSSVRCLKTAVPATMGVIINVLNNGLAQITTPGGTLQLQEQVTPATAGQGVTWSVTSGSEFATVNQNGLVTATANGTVIIQAASTENPLVTNTISITITGQVPFIQGLTIVPQNNAAPQIITYQGTLQLQAQVIPATVPQTVTWSVVAGSEFVTVSNTGLVTATANGVVTIQATSTVNPAITGTVNITVSGQVSAAPYCQVSVDWNIEPISRIVFAGIDNATSAVVNATPAYENFTGLTAEVNKGQTYTLQAEGNTVGLFSHDIRVFIDWNQDNEFDIDTEYYAGTIENTTGTDGTQAAISIPVPDNATTGTTRLRIIKDMWNVYEPGEFDACLNAYYGQVEDYSVNISDAPVPASVVVTTLNNTAPEITIPNGTLQLQAQVLPAAVNQEVTWSITAGSEFATVNANGLIIATANGIVTVQATSTANPQIAGIITITITGQAIIPESIAITVQDNAPAQIAVFEGTLQLQAQVLPAEANQEVTWSVAEGEDVITIDDNGLVTASADGIAVVQAVSTANPELIALITITVTNQVPPIPATPYCDVAVINIIEPITQVTFAGIDNTTSEVINGTPAYESFTGLTADVTQGETYTLTVKGNTNGNTSNNIRVYADWNQDNQFNADNEYYTAVLSNSTGVDNTEVVIQITIPENAIQGTTRLRIIKEAVTTDTADACTDIQAGQAEDYSVVVNETLSIPFDKNNAFSIYPNPVTAVLNVQSTQIVKSITVYNLTGQIINIVQGDRINVSHIASGIYMVKAEFENGTAATQKIIKK